MIYFKLVEMGMGSYLEVQELDASTVLQALNFNKFCKDYQMAYLELNK